MAQLQNRLQDEDRFPALRVIGAISSWIGFLLIAIGVAAFLLGIYGIVAAKGVQTPPMGNPFDPSMNRGLPPYAATLGTFSIFWSFGILAWGLLILAAGKFIGLAIQVEKNTRAAAMILEKLDRRSDPKQPEHDFIGELFKS